jgi:hypothetical protein
LVRTSRGFPSNPSLRDWSGGALRPEGPVIGRPLYTAPELLEALEYRGKGKGFTGSSQETSPSCSGELEGRTSIKTGASPEP